MTPVHPSQTLPSEKTIAEIVRRIVDYAHPDKIILFGSGARGELTENSDLDMMVIKPGVHRRKLAQGIYRQLFGVGISVDVIVVTPEDIEQFGDNPALIIEPALREGKVLYAV
jgi:uncharacterized protein